MAGYKDDRLAMKIANFDERLNQEDDVVGVDENTPEDMFFALGEEHAGEDSVEVATYDPSMFAWAGEKTLLSPTFARSSVAYSPETGGSVKANEPRYVSGKFDMGVVVEEGTTNLMPVNASSAETDLTGISTVGTAMVARSTVWAMHGSYSAYVQNAVDANNRVQMASFPVSTGQSYTATAYVYNPNDNAITVHGSIAGAPSIGTTIAPKSVGRVIGQWTSTATATTHFRLWNMAGTPFYVDCVQAEAKSYATSWVLGGTSRTAETLTLPTTGLTPTQGTIAAWVYVNSVARRLANGTVLLLRRGSGATRWIWLYHDSGSASWRLQMRDETGVNRVTITTYPDSNTPDGWHRFVVRYNRDEGTLAGFVNGVRAWNYTELPPDAFPTSYDSLNIGFREGATSDWLNTYFDNVVLDTIAWSDSDVAADYASGVPYAPTTTTTAVVNFDGSLTGENYEYTDAGFDWNYGGRWSDE